MSDVIILVKALMILIAIIAAMWVGDESKRYPASFPDGFSKVILTISMTVTGWSFAIALYLILYFFFYAW